MEWRSVLTQSRRSKLLFYARLVACQIAALFLNPRFVLWSVRQSAGQLAAALRARRRGLTEAEVADAALPLDGRWTVHSGGVTRASSHSWSILSQRFAYDFTRGEGVRTLDACAAFGAPVLAAAAGVVVAVRDGARDLPHAGGGLIDWRAADPRGNFVTIRHADDLFSHSAHLRAHSIRVAVGRQVAAGEVIAACGNSGHSTEPHLHFQMQDRADFFSALGRPVRFANAVIVAPDDPADAQASDAPGFVQEGQQVEPGPQAPPRPPGTRPSPVGAAEVWTGVFGLLVVALALRAEVGLLMWLLRLAA
jgi:hypothetical protein